jgi:uncharacterized repeat protein (TIGR01451 family)
MNFKFYPLRALLLTLLLFGFKAGVHAQTPLDFTKTVYNSWTGGDGTTAEVGETLVYTIYVRNMTSQNYVASKLYDNIPGGTSYVLGSTTLNGFPVTDKTVNGVVTMPYASNGGYINTLYNGIGILAPNKTAEIQFTVTVTANGGKVWNNATIEATQGGVATIQATNTVTTNVTVEAECNVVYQVTASASNGSSPYSFIRQVNTTGPSGRGQGGPMMYSGSAGNQREAAAPQNPISHNGGSGVDLLDGCAAIAYDPARNWIYFVNNSGGDKLCYLDLNTGTNGTYTAYRFSQSLETNTAGGWNVNRMGMGSDGYCYALTSNCRDLIKFYVNASGTLIIDRKGALTNAPTNGSRDILNDGGGDLFADGSGKLYLIANSGNMYRINPNTKVATYMGTVNANLAATQSLAIDATGAVYINGAYKDVYKLDLSTMDVVKINSSQSGVFESGDYTACGFPVLASSIIADKTYRNINGSPVINGGDTIEYTITVKNIGNINAAGVYMYDYIPPATIYIPGTTKLNGSGPANAVPDAPGGVMPYAVLPKGRLVNTDGEDAGIVRPGDANAAVVTFRVKTEPNKQVCNQSRITLYDADGNIMFVNSSDPGNVGQTPTCFYSDGVLPLTNLKFKGSLKDDKSHLEWSMNGDDNVSYYEVEFSENGSAYTVIGKVAGKGNTTNVNSYQFTDAMHAFASVRIYRLKVMQKDGKYTYSGIVTLNSKELDVQAMPNPFDRDLNVQIRLKTAETVRVRVLDFSGREVHNSTEQLGIGTHSIAVRIPIGLAKGMYVLDVQAGKDQSFQKKLMKN